MSAGRKRIIAGITVIAVVLAALLVPRMRTSAVFDETKAVTYRVFSASHEIEQSTLFIGTYLIHSQAITDELYEKAQDSASQANQFDVYYKSELAGGAWYDITDAEGLTAISGQSAPVDEDDMGDLWVTHYVGSDGIVHDARDDSAVNPFDVPDPYDLYNLPELEAIRIQYDNQFSAASEGVDKYYYDQLQRFFALNLQNDVTAECDRQLDGLQSCYETLEQNDEKELAEIVSTLMSRIDARRRAEIFSALSQIDDNELNKLQEVCSGSLYNEDDYDDEQFVEDTNVSDAIGSAMQSCQESYIEQSGKMLEQGTTVLKSAEYDKSMEVVNGSSGGWNEELRPVLLELQHLYHIQDDVIADAEAELTLLNGELIPDAEQKYAEELTGGTRSSYDAAVADGASQAAREQLLEEQKTELEAVRSELQYLQQARAKRMDTEEAIDGLYQEINRMEELRSDIPDDAFSEKAQESVDSAVLDLQKLAQSVAEGDAEYKSEMQQLEERKQELQDEKANALDDNDLSTAKRCDAQIALVDELIDEKEAELQAILNNENSSAAEKARAAGESGDATLLNNINRMKEDALSAVADGSASEGNGFSNVIGALASLGAEDALTEIRDKLEDSGETKLAREVDSAIEDSRSSSLNPANSGSGSGGSGSGSGGSGSGAGGSGSGSGGSGSGSGSGSGAGGSGSGSGSGGSGSGGSGSGSGGSGSGSGSGAGGSGSGSGAGAADPDAAIEDTFGEPFDELSDSDKAAAVAGLASAGADGKPDTLDQATDLLYELLGQNSPYVFTRYEGTTEEYIPLATIAKCEKYRYVYDDTRERITLSGSKGVYRFTVYGKEITLRDKSKAELKSRVELQDKLPYLSEQDATKLFSCECEYISGTSYGICIDEKMRQKMDELESALQ